MNTNGIVPAARAQEQFFITLSQNGEKPDNEKGKIEKQQKEKRIAEFI